MFRTTYLRNPNGILPLPSQSLGCAVLLVVLGLLPFANCRIVAADETVRALDDYDVAWMGDRDYDAAVAAATRLVELGDRRRDDATKARGLIRLAFAELYFGRWGAGWEENRDEAYRLSENGPSPNIAKAESLIFDGYLTAVYGGDIDGGVETLLKAIPIARATQDDRALAIAYHLGFRAVALQGKMSDAFDYAYRSLLFAHQAEMPVAELEAITYILLMQKNSPDYEDLRKRLRERYEVLRKKYDLPSWEEAHEVSPEQLRATIQKGWVVLDKPVQESLEPTINGMNAAVDLLDIIVENRQWDKIEPEVNRAMAFAEKLSDNSTLQAVKMYLAYIETATGDPRAVDEHLNDYIALLEQIQAFHAMAEMYESLAECASDAGHADVALEWLTKAVAARRRDDPSLHMESSAIGFFDAVMNERELQQEIYQREEHLATLRTVAIAVPLVAISCFLLFRSWSVSNQRRKLASLVEERTRDLEVARDKAVSANKAKNEFLARVNHEIRNPLTAIVTSSELLSSGQANSDSRGKLEEILQASTRHLVDIVDDVLDFTKIEAGVLQSQPSIFSPREMLKTVAAIVSPACTAYTELRIVCCDELPRMVVADEQKLRQVLINLGCNAAKCTDTGTITIHCQYIESQNKLSFDVADTGIGIPADDLESIFDIYSSQSKSKGTGLGLYISRKFVECMGGEISVSSEVGVGSTFSFGIHVEVSSQATTTLKVSRVGNGAILYVEDEILNRQAIGALFQQRGYEGTIVENWEQAREAILQVIPVIIFMDLRMPKQDGFEVAKLIREMLGEKTPPIYALTGDATNAVRKKVLDHGFKGLIAKPVRGDELVRIINAEAVSRDDGTSWKSA